MEISKLYQIFLQCSNVCTDTRRIVPNSIFFALKGDNFDANLFAASALANGCSYAIIDNHTVAVDERYILVDNVLETLQRLANYHRRQLALPILAITGTNGKTTTKELIGCVLSEKYKIGITTGNLNNHIGVPLTLLGMNKKTAFGVVEMGANHPGEIAELCSIAEPNYGLITNVGKAHLEGFGSLEGVRKTKGELYDYLQRTNGIAFVNTDDTTLQSMANERTALKIESYSASLYNVEISVTNNQNPFLSFSINQSTQIKTLLLGDYNLNNALAAISIGEFLGINMHQISDAIQSYHPKNNRSQLIHTKHNTIFMDAYNANPSSMEVSIRNFSQINEKNKLLILGDMLELGNESLIEHQKIIKQLINLGFEKVWLVGDNFTKTMLANSQFMCFNNVNEVITYLNANLINNYTILIKGSRGIKLEKVLEQL